MAKWKLFVKNYGKIDRAEIECAPLTLIVGDNNCGKSYLMSLLWGIKNYGIMRFMDGNMIWKTESSKKVINWMSSIIEKTGEGCKTDTKVSYDICLELENLVNEFMKCNKDALLSWIFNSNTVHADEIRIVMNKEECLNYSVCCEKKAQHIAVEICYGTYNCCKISYGIDGWIEGETEQNKVFNICFLIKALVSEMLECVFHVGRNQYTYLPAARTGFMLAKDVVNKVGREQTFNYPGESTNIIPFTRPINQFLDIINDLTIEPNGSTQYISLAKDIERYMLNGNVDISNTANKEVFYTPNGENKNIPLRTVSAVVTELTPLVLLLKHSEKINDLYYEEPEMCLHPQLQNMMSKVLVRMVNEGIHVVATTHSDILIQGINNRIKLYSHPEKDRICGELNIQENELIDANDVSVYQFEIKNNKSRLTKLECGENGFIVPTFNNALDMIMEEAYKIQG